MEKKCLRIRYNIYTTAHVLFFFLSTSDLSIPLCSARVGPKLPRSMVFVKSFATKVGPRVIGLYGWRIYCTASVTKVRRRISSNPCGRFSVKFLHHYSRGRPLLSHIPLQVREPPLHKITIHPSTYFSRNFACQYHSPFQEFPQFSRITLQTHPFIVSYITPTPPGIPRVFLYKPLCNPTPI